MFAITELPPKLTNGSVTPVSGMNSHDAADDHDRLEREHRRQARGQELREAVAAPSRRS